MLFLTSRWFFNLDHERLCCLYRRVTLFCLGSCPQPRPHMRVNVPIMQMDGFTFDEWNCVIRDLQNKVLKVDHTMEAVTALISNVSHSIRNGYPFKLTVDHQNVMAHFCGSIITKFHYQQKELCEIMELIMHQNIAFGLNLGISVWYRFNKMYYGAPNHFRDVLCRPFYFCHPGRFQFVDVTVVYLS